MTTNLLVMLSVIVGAASIGLWLAWVAFTSDEQPKVDEAEPQREAPSQTELALGSPVTKTRTTTTRDFAGVIEH